MVSTGFDCLQQGTVRQGVEPAPRSVRKSPILKIARYARMGAWAQTCSHSGIVYWRIVTMIRLLTTGIILTALAASAAAQDWYHEREERFRGEQWRPHLFMHVR